MRADGRRTQAVETIYNAAGSSAVQSNTFIWNYDAANRLTSDQLTSDIFADYTTTYEFDLVGNRLAKEEKGVRTIFLDWPAGVQ